MRGSGEPPTAARLISMAQVTEMLGVSRVSVYRWTKDGAFPSPIKLSERRVMWRQSDINSWLASRPTPPAYTSVSLNHGDAMN